MSKKNLPLNKEVLGKLFSKKEEEIIKQEINDPDASKRNVPEFIAMLETWYPLRPLLFDSMHIMEMMSAFHQKASANMTITANRISENDIINVAIKTLAPMVNPQLVLEQMVTVIKEVKVKRHKRILLWACAELIRSYAARTPHHENLINRAIIIASIDKSARLSDAISDFLSGKEPFNFSYNDVIDTEFQPEDLYQLQVKLYDYEPDISMYVCYQANYIHQISKREIGLPFYYVLSYPEAIKESKSSLIQIPGQAQNPDANLSEEEQEQKIIENVARGYMQDFLFWNNETLAKRITEEASTADFSKFQDENRRTQLLNAVAYASYFIVPMNPFLLDLYRRSGEKAESINPEDEKNYILDLKRSPNNLHFLLKYGNHLYEKGNLEGAGVVYSKYKLVVNTMPDTTMDETAQTRLDEITKKFVFVDEGLKISLEEQQKET